VITSTHFRFLAEHGNPDAQCNLGLVSANGDGVPDDDAQAAYWICKAAEQGDANAQFRLVGMYIVAAGVPTNLAKGCG